MQYFTFQGANASALEKEIGPEQFPVNEHYFGLVNVSTNTTRLTIAIGQCKFPSMHLHQHNIYQSLQYHGNTFANNHNTRLIMCFLSSSASPLSSICLFSSPPVWEHLLL